MSGTDTPEASGTVTPAARAAPGQANLARVVGRMAWPVFAIVDGGHFDNLPVLLSGSGLLARSLFLGHGERETERFGPWFGSVGSADDVAKVLGLMGDLPAVVFWSCASGDVALYRHLRRLNMARLPAWAAAGKTGPEPGVEADRGWEAVLFRHWDPGVLGALLPVLDEGQFSRILGPAQEVAFFAADYGGSKRVVADPDWPLAPAGMLTIRPDQVAALTKRRVEAQRRRVAGYLRGVAPQELETLNDIDFRQLIIASEESGRGLGLKSEQAHGRWAYVMVRTKGNALQQPGLRDYITDGQISPDEKVDHLLRTIAAAEASGTKRT